MRIPGLAAGSIEGVRLTTVANSTAGIVEGGRHSTSGGGGSHTMQRNRKPTNSQHSLLTLPRSHSSYRQQFSSATAAMVQPPPSRVAPSGVLGEHAGSLPPSSALSSTQHSPLEDSGLPRRKQLQVNINLLT